MPTSPQMISRLEHTGRSVIAGYALLLAFASPALAAKTMTTTASVAPDTVRSSELIPVEITVTASATTVPTGNVTVKEGIRLLATATLDKGKAKVSLAPLGLGVHDLKVEYGGDTAFDASSTSINLNVSFATGREVKLSSFASGTQTDPAFARLADGSVFAAWTAPGQDSSGPGLAVVGRITNAALAPVGGEFRINFAKDGDQMLPAIAPLANGDGAVVWRDGKRGLRARIFSKLGKARTAEIPVETAENAGTPTIAPMGSGFVVVWPTRSITGLKSAIVMRRFAATGTAIGSRIRVDGARSGFAFSPTVSSLASGGVVLGWVEAPFENEPGKVLLRGFDRRGNPLGAARVASVNATSPKASPSVAGLPDGTVVLVWSAYKQNGTDWDIFGRRFLSPAGAPAGGEFSVPSVTQDDQTAPVVSAFSTGDFTVAWQSADGNGNGIFARRFTRLAVAKEIATRVNRSIGSDQTSPVAATFADGKAVLIWVANTVGIVAQRLDFGASPK